MSRSSLAAAAAMPVFTLQSPLRNCSSSAPRLAGLGQPGYSSPSSIPDLQTSTTITGRIRLTSSEADSAEFQKGDIGADGAVVVRMTVIFTIGLLLGGVIARIVSRHN